MLHDKRRGGACVFWLTLVTAAACSSRTTEEPATQRPATSTPVLNANDAAAAGVDRPGQQEAQRLYASFCSTCHGPTGRGDGSAAQGLSVRPRDYSDRAWQASVTDQSLAKVIVEGGGAVGKSVLMPASPTLKDKPEVVSELIALIRSFAVKK